MFAPLFETCAANIGVTNLLGTNPVRLYPFGNAPQDVVKPYAVYQRIGGEPNNNLSDIPDGDSVSYQIDVYDLDESGVEPVVKALRDVLEPVAYIVRWGFEGRETDTKLYRSSFDVDWIINERD